MKNRRTTISPSLLTLEDRTTPSTVPILTAVHADIGLAFEGGEWDLHIHDETNDVEYAPDEALLYVGPQAKQTVPVGSQWSFLGSASGQNLWVLPQTSSPPLLFLGFGSEEIEPDVFETDITLNLVGVRGAGHFSAYTQDSFGSPVVSMATSDGITSADTISIAAGSHAHYNLAFTQPGRYEVDFEAVATLVGGEVVSSGVVTYMFQVQVVPKTAELIPVSKLDGTVEWLDQSGAAVHSLNLPAQFVRGSIASTPDRTNDNFPDLIVGTGSGRSSQVAFVDGKTGAILTSHEPFAASFRGGVDVASGDINGDGVADLLAAAGPGGGPHVRVFDGKTGAELRSFHAYRASFTGGVTIASGDVNGDGRDDIVTGTGAGGGPNVRVFSGINNAMIRDFHAYTPTYQSGVSVAVGDFNGDGYDDIMTGTMGHSSLVRVFSGDGNGMIADFQARPNSPHGIRVVSADLNGDGVDELNVLAAGLSNSQLISYRYSSIAPFTSVLLATYNRSPFQSLFIVNI